MDKLKQSRYITKKDALQMLETAYFFSTIKKQENFSQINDKLQTLFSFEGAFLTHIPLLSLDDNNSHFFFGAFDREAEHEFYTRRRFGDPIGKEVLRTLDLVDIGEYYKRNSASVRNNPVYQLFNELDLKSGIADGFLDHTGMNLTGFAFHGPYLKVDQRLRTVIKYVGPFMTEMYQRFLSNPSSTLNQPALTKREITILEWLKEGKTSWEISMILDISERTVNFHIANLMHKLNVTKRMQAVAAAVSRGIISF